MRLLRIGAVAAILGALLMPLTARAYPSIDSVLDDLYTMHGLRSLAISPDGRQLAYIETVQNIASATDPTPHSAIRIVSTAGGESTRLTAGNGTTYFDEEDPVWAPDGKHIAFISDARSTGQLQIFIADPDGTHVRMVSHLVGDVADPRWSPDGTRLAFLYIPGAPVRSGPLVARARDAGVVGSKVYEQRLSLLDPADGSVRELSPADTYVYEYDWAPDGHAFAITYAHGDGDNNWWIAKLATLDARTGAISTLLSPALQIADPRWSPDGGSIAFIEGLMSDEGSTGGDVFAIPAGGGTARDLTPNFDGSAAAISWIAGGPTLLVSEHREGSVRLTTLDANNGALTPVVDDPAATISGAQLARDGRTIAYVHQSFTDAPEIYAGPLGDAKPITHVNANIVRYWGAAKSITWVNDGYHVQGWLLAPRDVIAGRRYPMIVVVHGGPAAESTATFPFRQTAALTSQGYYVFMPNPRGSFGQGERFTQANVKDFGYGDLRDVLTGVDAAVQAAPIDPKRVGLYGWSYGGYMAMWAVTQTNRFAAAVAGAGVANWQSYYGENGIDQWMIPYFGASVYEDPAIYARSSPITFITHVTTPTLVLHGERDTEVPAPQGYEFWHALKTLGVPTELVIYPDEGHGVAKPADQKDIARRLVAWFNQYMKAR